MKKVDLKKIDLSIIVPVFNSQNILPKLVNSIFFALKKKKNCFRGFFD